MLDPKALGGDTTWEHMLGRAMGGRHSVICIITIFIIATVSAAFWCSEIGVFPLLPLTCVATYRRFFISSLAQSHNNTSEQACPGVEQSAFGVVRFFSKGN